MADVYSGERTQGVTDGLVDIRQPIGPTVGRVLVRLGPLPSAGAESWIAYAREVLAAVPTDAGGDGVWLPSDAIAGFEQYLGEWASTAAADPTFTWEGDVPREEAEYLFHAFFRVATHLSTQAEVAGPQAPEEGNVFYRALVTGLLNALDHAGGGASEFSEHLRSFWPGLEA